MSCIAWARRKTGAPKFSEALIFLWLLSLYQDKESNNDLGQRPINNNKPTPAPSREGNSFLVLMAHGAGSIPNTASLKPKEIY